MKKFMILASSLLLAGITYSQKTVAADSLKYYVEEVVTVCHTVSTTFCTKTPEKTTLLTFGTFPKQLFTVVIYEEDLKNFSYSPAVFLKGKKLCVTGDVLMYISGPEIIVEREDQIQVIE